MNTEKIIRSLKSYGSFAAHEIDAFLSACNFRKLEADDSILTFGEVCRQVSFVDSGSFVQSFKDKELNQKVVNLFVNGDWVLNHASFTAQKPSQHEIVAFETSEIFTLNIHQVHELIGKYPSFFALGKILEVDTPRLDHLATPDEKYLRLLKEKPKVIQTFPLKYIASFLGMTPETLSRVRSRIN